LDYNTLSYNEQYAWLESTNQLLDEDVQNKSISWSAYFANLQEFVPLPPAITGLLPLFRESAHTLAMVKHGMDIIKTATNHLNPGQIPVLTVDQPLYAIAKKIQWTWTNMYGEDKYVLLMGGLHIEMALLSVLGDWLEGSGWKVMLSNADVTTEGRADSLQRGSDTARAQWAHQVSAAAFSPCKPKRILHIRKQQKHPMKSFLFQSGVKKCQQITRSFSIGTKACNWRFCYSSSYIHNLMQSFSCMWKPLGKSFHRCCITLEGFQYM